MGVFKGLAHSGSKVLGDRTKNTSSHGGLVGMNLYATLYLLTNYYCMKDLLDYSSEGFTISIQRDNVKTYASINVEMYYDDHQLEPTGHYFIYLLHPFYGSCAFLIEQVIATGNWFSKNAPDFVADDIIQEIGTAISFSKKQAGLISKRAPEL